MPARTTTVFGLKITRRRRFPREDFVNVSVFRWWRLCRKQTRTLIVWRATEKTAGCSNAIKYFYFYFLPSYNWFACTYVFRPMASVNTTANRLKELTAAYELHRVISTHENTTLNHKYNTNLFCVHSIFYLLIRWKSHYYYEDVTFVRNRLCSLKSILIRKLNHLFIYIDKILIIL